MANSRAFVFPCDETYFFRSGKPFQAGLHMYAESMFPPNPHVMQGVVRTALMLGHDIDFTSYYEGWCNTCNTSADACSVLRAVGSAGRTNDMELELSAPYVVHLPTQEKLFPAPLDVARLQFEKNDVTDRYIVFQPDSQPVSTDLGNVLLPAVPADSQESVWRVEPVEDAWLTESGLKRYLRGEQVRDEDVVSTENIAGKERRAGVARNRKTRGTLESHLYFAEHIRLKTEYGLGVDVRNLPDSPVPSVVKLGGEGRLTSLQIGEARSISEHQLAEALKEASGQFSGFGFKIVLLSPTRFASNSFLPDTFQPATYDGVQVWEGRLENIQCTFITACMQRTVRLSGWDMKRGQAKPRYAYLPAGTVLYFVTEHDPEEVVQLLHDRHIGLDTSIGHGHIVVGRW